MKTYLKFIMFCSFLTGQVRIGDWESITASHTVNDILVYGDTIISATNGGLLLLNENNSFELLTLVDGLAFTAIELLFKGPQGFIWLAGAGVIQVYDLAKHESKGIINFNLDEVIDFGNLNGVVYAATRLGSRWGIMEFKYIHDQYIYGDQNEHPTLENISAMEVIGDTIYLGTNLGLLAGNPHQTHISMWDLVFKDVSGPIRVMAEKNGELIAIMEKAAFSYIFGEPEVRHFTDSRFAGITGVVITGTGNYIALSDSNIYQIGDDSLSIMFPNPGFIFKCLELEAEDHIIVGSDMGLIIDGNIFNPRINPGPLVESPTALALFPNGSLIMASKAGISFKNGEKWQNWSPSINLDLEANTFNLRKLPFNLGTRVNVIEILADGSVFLALQGSGAGEGGVLIINNIITDFVNMSVADSLNLPYLIEKNGESSFQILDFALDLNSSLWIISLNSQDKPLSVFTGSAWKSYSISESQAGLSRSVTAVAVDNFNRVWIGAEENGLLNAGLPRNGGLSMLTISGDPAAPDEQNWISIDLNPGFQNNTVLDIAVSPQNRIYILTPIGLFYKDLQISKTDPVLKNGPLNSNGSLYPYFPNVPFPPGSKVQIDPRGNVWISSPAAGVRVLLENGEYWPDVFGFTQENSVLLSNEVSRVSFDEKKGLAYLATDKGINIIRIPFALKNKSYNRVHIFPSPFRIPSRESLVIGNLKDKTNVKIMTLSGRVIRSIKHDSKNYQVFWDGRDDQGRWVSSGVYLIAVYDKGGASKIEKITVIKY
ncbi:MAG: hypothetical protein V3S48_05795 [Candidatus Neomarinimicrobiota bacterium]